MTEKTTPEEMENRKETQLLDDKNKKIDRDTLIVFIIDKVVGLPILILILVVGPLDTYNHFKEVEKTEKYLFSEMDSTEIYDVGVNEYFSQYLDKLEDYMKQDLNMYKIEELYKVKLQLEKIEEEYGEEITSLEISEKILSLEEVCYIRIRDEELSERMAR